MSSLLHAIKNRIIMHGPLSLADYMSLCLTHPQHGYYTSRTPIGGADQSKTTQGDFITAPEVSQMFGELIAVWCMQTWQEMGQPQHINLIEIGPGRGTLMKDLLRAAKALPAFHKALSIHLIEISPTLKEQQKQTLSNDAEKISWLDDHTQMPHGPALIIANELLDALPFYQWVKQGKTWHERTIGLDDKEELFFTSHPRIIEAKELPPHHIEQQDGTIFETSPSREAFIASISHHLCQHKGAALFIDYGHLTSGFGDSFQAVQNHQFTSPFANPGQADLTNHVDFEPLIYAAKQAGCSQVSTSTQAEFLLKHGLLERVGQLGAQKNSAVQDTLRAAVERLAGPEQMGDLFKTLIIKP